MASLPDGDVPPGDGSLPAEAALGAQDRDFSVYVHVPFCSVRCGYCDFNTYTAIDLGGGATRAAYSAMASTEIDLAARVLTHFPQREVSTVFFGGGTPTQLPAADLIGILTRIERTWGLAADAEVTTEANPDSVDEPYLGALAAAGFTRISFGMQSAVPRVLATLDRTHDPARLAHVVRAAKAVGLSVSVDLIYGTPGESLRDWQASVDAALALEPDHISAYALVVEDGTKMGSLVRRGLLPAPEDDDEASKYDLADGAFSAAGYHWYEVSNWSTSEASQCRHNLAYWRSQDWWGIGPGAHSHIGGVRWWNVKHPRAYADRLTSGLSPEHAREVLSAPSRAMEDILLRVRLAEGLPTRMLAPGAVRHLDGLVADGLIDEGAAHAGRVILTLRGRMLADVVVRALT